MFKHNLANSYADPDDWPTTWADLKDRLEAIKIATLSPKEETPKIYYISKSTWNKIKQKRHLRHDYLPQTEMRTQRASSESESKI